MAVWSNGLTTSTGGNITLRIEPGYSNNWRSGNTCYYNYGGRMGHGSNISGTSTWSENQFAVWLPAGGTKHSAKAGQVRSVPNTWYYAGGTSESTPGYYSGTHSGGTTSLWFDIGFGWNAWNATQGNTRGMSVPFNAALPPTYTSIGHSSVARTSVVLSASINGQGYGITSGGWEISTNGGSSWTTHSGGPTSKTITGLQANTKYWYRGYATTSAGSSKSGWSTFTTTGNAPTISDTFPTDITRNYVYLGLMATYDTNASFKSGMYEYGLSSNNLVKVASILSSNGIVLIRDLLPATTYYYRVSVTDNYSRKSAYKTGSFTTQGAIPLVLVHSVVSNTSTSATLHFKGSYDLEATFASSLLEYGKTTSYGSSTTGNKLTGLDPNTTYYYKLTITDNRGITSEPVYGTFDTSDDKFVSVVKEGIVKQGALNVIRVLDTEVEIPTRLYSLPSGVRDVLYQESDTWYIDKKVEHIQLNGTETWTTEESINGVSRYSVTLSNKAVISDGIFNIMSDSAPYITKEDSDAGLLGVSITGDFKITFNINTDEVPTLSYFKNILTNEPVDVLYELFTPLKLTLGDYPIVSDGLEGDTTQDVSGTLPDGYIPVHYIQGYGNQYINTGFIPSLETRVHISFYPSDIENYVYGVTFDEEPHDKHAFGINDVDKVSFEIGEYASDTQFDIELNRVYNMVNSRYGGYLDGVLKRPAVSQYEFQNILPLYLFAININNTPGHGIFRGRIYSCKIYDDGGIVRDFIPCIRQDDEVVGMYDVVNGAFYSNRGTGSFSAGGSLVLPSLSHRSKLNGLGVSKNLLKGIQASFTHNGVQFTNHGNSSIKLNGVIGNNNTWITFTSNDNKTRVFSGSSYLLSLQELSGKIDRNIKNVKLHYSDLEGNELGYIDYSTGLSKRMKVDGYFTKLEVEFFSNTEFTNLVLGCMLEEKEGSIYSKFRSSNDSLLLPLKHKKKIDKHDLKVIRYVEPRILRVGDDLTGAKLLFSFEPWVTNDIIDSIHNMAPAGVKKVVEFESGAYITVGVGQEGQFIKFNEEDGSGDYLYYYRPLSQSIQLDQYIIPANEDYTVTYLNAWSSGILDQIMYQGGVPIQPAIRFIQEGDILTDQILYLNLPTDGWLFDPTLYNNKTNFYWEYKLLTTENYHILVQIDGLSSQSVSIVNTVTDDTEVVLYSHDGVNTINAGEEVSLSLLDEEMGTVSFVSFYTPYELITIEDYPTTEARLLDIGDRLTGNLLEFDVDGFIPNLSTTEKTLLTTTNAKIVYKGVPLHGGISGGPLYLDMKLVVTTEGPYYDWDDRYYIMGTDVPYRATGAPNTTYPYKRKHLVLTQETGVITNIDKTSVLYKHIKFKEGFFRYIKVGDDLSGRTIYPSFSDEWIGVHIDYLSEYDAVVSSSGSSITSVQGNDYENEMKFFWVTVYTQPLDVPSIALYEYSYSINDYDMILPSFNIGSVKLPDNFGVVTDIDPWTKIYPHVLVETTSEEDVDLTLPTRVIISVDRGTTIPKVKYTLTFTNDKTGQKYYAEFNHTNSVDEVVITDIPFKWQDGYTVKLTPYSTGGVDLDYTLISEDTYSGYSNQSWVEGEYLGWIPGEEDMGEFYNSISIQLRPAAEACLSGDTLISTPDGGKQIKDIRVGDVVITTEGQDVVKKMYSHIAKPVLVINNTITSSLFHKFITNGEPILARDLVVGHLLDCYDGSSLEVTSIDVKIEDTVVYEIKTKRDEKYILFDSGVINKSEDI